MVVVVAVAAQRRHHLVAAVVVVTVAVVVVLWAVPPGVVRRAGVQARRTWQSGGAGIELSSMGKPSLAWTSHRVDVCVWHVARATCIKRVRSQ